MENQISTSFQNKQKEQIVRVLKFRLEIKRLSLTFYLGESDLVSFCFKFYFILIRKCFIRLFVVVHVMKI